MNPSSPLTWAAQPHLELLSASHLHLAFQPLMSSVPTCAPHSQLALGTVQKHSQLALI